MTNAKHSVRRRLGILFNLFLLSRSSSQIKLNMCAPYFRFVTTVQLYVYINFRIQICVLYMTMCSLLEELSEVNGNVVPNIFRIVSFFNNKSFRDRGVWMTVALCTPEHESKPLGFLTSTYLFCGTLIGWLKTSKLAVRSNYVFYLI